MAAPARLTVLGLPGVSAGTELVVLSGVSALCVWRVTKDYSATCGAALAASGIAKSFYQTRAEEQRMELIAEWKRRPNPRTPKSQEEALVKARVVTQEAQRVFTQSAPCDGRKKEQQGFRPVQPDHRPRFHSA